MCACCPHGGEGGACLCGEGVQVYGQEESVECVIVCVWVTEWLTLAMVHPSAKGFRSDFGCPHP